MALKGNENRILVIACGMIAREVMAVRRHICAGHIDLTCLPAAFHYRPERIGPAMEKAILAARQKGYRQIFIGYADCGTGGALDRLCEQYGVSRIAGPHCFAFYQGIQNHERLGDADMLSFYMTDFLCRHFEAFFLKPLKLDKHPELIKAFFGNYEKLVYLAQTENPAFDQVAEDAARLLGLSYEKRATGYGDLQTTLASLPVPA